MTRWRLLLILGLVLPGCPQTDGTGQEPDPCAATTDRCDGVDNDCDGAVDEDAAFFTWYPDVDEDTYGTDQGAIDACDHPEGTTQRDGDCDDSDATRSPEAVETCDGLDNNCDDLIDDDDPNVEGQESTWLDADEDGYGAGPKFKFCDAPDGYVDNNDDCDDDDASITGPITYYTDGDGDGYGAGDPIESCGETSGFTLDNTDCDDSSPRISPGADEVCLDSLDNDCDGTNNGCVPIEGEVAISASHGVITGSSSYFGYNLDQVDTDGDGLMEVLTSAPYALSYYGALYLFEGVTPGTSTSERSAAYLVSGSSTWPYYGFSAAGLGDIDGDGYDEVGARSGSDATALLMSGPLATSDSLTSASAALANLSSVWATPNTMLDGFEPDTDGLSGVVVGEPNGTSSYSAEGVVYLLRTAPSGKVDTGSVADASVWGNSEYGYLGGAVATLGDTNGDGVGEVGMGAYGYSAYYSYGGALGVLSGDASGTYALEDVDTTLLGEDSSRYLGYSASRLGDVNADGYADVVVNSLYDTDYGASGTGAVFVYFGPLDGGPIGSSYADQSYYGLTNDANYGFQARGVGDLDGDGASDLGIGAYGESSNAGAVYLYYGDDSRGRYTEKDADARIYGSSSVTLIGYSFAGIGDQDADGYDDLTLAGINSYGLYFFYGGSL